MKDDKQAFVQMIDYLLHAYVKPSERRHALEMAVGEAKPQGNKSPEPKEDK